MRFDTRADLVLLHYPLDSLSGALDVRQDYHTFHTMFLLSFFLLFPNGWCMDFLISTTPPSGH